MSCNAAFTCCKRAAVGLNIPTMLRLTKLSRAAVVVSRFCYKFEDEKEYSGLTESKFGGESYRLPKAKWTRII